MVAGDLALTHCQNNQPDLIGPQLIQCAEEYKKVFFRKYLVPLYLSFGQDITKIEKVTALLIDHEEKSSLPSKEDELRVALGAMLGNGQLPGISQFRVGIVEGLVGIRQIFSQSGNFQDVIDYFSPSD